MAGGGPPGLPPLSFSSGPAVSSAAGYDGTAATGDFFFKRESGAMATIERLAPLILLGGVAWLLTR